MMNRNTYQRKEEGKHCPKLPYIIYSTLFMDIFWFIQVIFAQYQSPIYPSSLTIPLLNIIHY